MPGLLDTVSDYLFPARKPLEKAAGKTNEPSAPCPNCGTGISQSDIAKMAQDMADKAKAAKTAPAVTPPKAAPAPKKTSSIADMMEDGNA